MKRLMYFSMIFVVLGLLWGCSENASLPTNNSLSESSDTEGSLNKGIDLEATFEVTLENLTPATGPGASQPLSPPVTATHKRNFHVFQKGELASDAVAAVAEDAHNTPLVNALNSSGAVYDVEVGGGPILPGSAVTFTIKTKLGFNRISLISMLVNTNDGFTGIDAIPLPLHGSRTIYLPSYDGGSEKNTELKAHIPGPCCGNPFQGIDTAEPIKFHEGIQGVGDLDPAVYDWDEPTAKLTVTRIE